MTKKQLVKVVIVFYLVLSYFAGIHALHSTDSARAAQDSLGRLELGSYWIFSPLWAPLWEVGSIISNLAK